MNDDEHFLFIRLRLENWYIAYIMCGKKRLNPFFRLHETSEVLNKSVKGLWSDNFNAAFLLM